MCQNHYEFYVRDKKTLELSDDVIAVYEKRASFIQRLKSFIHNIIHHALDIPMPRYEHFPLEHIYINALQAADRQNIGRLNQIISDFDIPENENIAMMKRIADSNNIEAVKVQPLENYLFNSKEQLKKWPLLISFLGIIGIYVILKLYGLSGLFCGLYAENAIEVYAKSIPLITIGLMGIYLGILIPRHYNNFAKRAYNLNLYERTEDNIALLTQIGFVKDRNTRADSYKYSICGSMLGTAIVILLYYFANSDFSINGFMLIISTVIVILPVLYGYSISVLYFPVFECMKYKTLKVNLYHADRMGGQKEYYDYLFKTFIYNETIVSIIFVMYSIYDNWWAWILLSLLLINRFNHAGACVIMYIKSLLGFYKRWNAEIDELMVSSDKDALLKRNALTTVHISKGIIRFSKLCVIVFIPYCINHIDDWYPVIKNTIIWFINYIAI